MVEKFRYLKADEIVCSVINCDENGVGILLKKNGFCDMRILDETVGPEFWQMKYDEIGGNLFCSVGIKSDGEWVWKQNTTDCCGRIEDKPHPGDSFRQVCSDWGIGRELQSAPTVRIDKKKVTLLEGDGIYHTNDVFRLENILVEYGKIAAIAIWNVTLNCRAYLMDCRKR